MTQLETTATQQPTTAENQVQPKQDTTVTKEEEYKDRFLDGNQRIIAYDLLEARGKSSETSDPDVKRYQQAKEIFRKGYDLAMSIPRTLEDSELEEHEEDIKTAAEYLVDAWLLDDKAAPMSERILILGQQYEKVLLKNIPEEQREGFFVKRSLLFSAWILMVGRQYQHCLETLSLAIKTYDDLPGRVYFIRASCYFSTGKLKNGLKDLDLCLQKDPKFAVAYSVKGSVHMNLNERDQAIKAFRQFLERGHPDTADYISTLYSLSVLLHEKNKKPEGNKYYKRAQKAEARFKELYGTSTGMNETKRQAIRMHEPPAVAEKLIFDAMPAKEYTNRIDQLIAAGIFNSPFPPSTENCSNCGAAHLKDEPGKPLLCCGGCRSIWYCSRDCQVKDFKAGHKVICKKAAAAAAAGSALESK